MAYVINKTARILNLPPLKCEKTHRSLRAVTLKPRGNHVPDEYLVQACGAGEKDQFVIRGKKEGHPDVRAVLQDEELVQITDISSTKEDTFPKTFEGMKIDEINEVLSKVDDRARLLDYRTAESDSRRVRKGVLKAIDARIDEIDGKSEGA